MNKEEIEAIEYFEHKIKNKLPLYEETYVDGKPYRRNILQLETNFTEEQADKTEILLNLIDKLQKENKKYIDIFNSTEKIMNGQERTKDKLLKENVELQKELDNSISKDKVREVLKDIYFYYGQNNDTFLVDKIRKELLGE